MNDCPTNDRGSVTAMFALLAVFLFAIVGLLAEGGRKLSNLSHAEDIAAEAARSAAATLDLASVARGEPQIDVADDRARTQAELIVDTVPSASIERFVVTADRVQVAVRISGESWIPGFDVDAVGSHTALALDPRNSSLLLLDPDR